VIVLAILVAVAALVAATRLRLLPAWGWFAVAAAVPAALLLLRSWIPLVAAAVALGVTRAARGRAPGGAVAVAAVLAAVVVTSAVWLLVLWAA
jgi:hypothetical protein